MAIADKPVTKKEDPAPVKAKPVPLVSDEGVNVIAIDGDAMQAVTPKSPEFAPPFSVRVSGRTYYHVGESAEGCWIYRFIR